MDSKNSIVKVEALTKRFNGTAAVRNISFEVGSGEIVGFLGPNGAGKTTTMRMLCCYLPITSGSATVAGYDILSHPVEVRRNVGYLPENVPLYDELRVREYLSYRGSLKGLRGKKLRTRISDCLEACDLQNVRKSIIGRLSRGYRQRVGLADALLADPRLLIMDEPTIGLDPNQIRRIRDQIRALAPDHSVLLSSHILHEVETTCQRVLIIDEGQIVASGPPDRLIAMLKGSPHLSVEVGGAAAEIEEQLGKIKGINTVKRETEGTWNYFTCECDKNSDPRQEVFRAIADRGWVLREMVMEKPNLEDVFVAMTTEPAQGNEVLFKENEDPTDRRETPDA